jgi:rfaE bifunctional protein nucleotidyltransferase chain/domain
MKTSAKVLTRSELVEALRPLRAGGMTIALANGLFDLLHVGHLRFLEGASLEADLLVVAVNSDVSARALKGPDRPLVPESERAELVAGFESVDYVTIFDEGTVEALLRALRPDVHCKGTDYTAESVPERAVAQELGIRIAIVGDAKAHATRDLIRQIRKASPPDFA